MTREQSLAARFDEQHRLIAAMLAAASDGEAERPTDASAWTAAQIGYHVGTVDIGFSKVLDGRVPGVVELPEGHHRPWAEIARTAPRMEAPENVRPPAHVSRTDALARLEFGRQRVMSALSALSDDRGERYGWTHPLLGLLSLFELGEWLVSHTGGHRAQIGRVLAASATIETAES